MAPEVVLNGTGIGTTWHGKGVDSIYPSEETLLPVTMLVRTHVEAELLREPFRLEHGFNLFCISKLLTIRF